MQSIDSNWPRDNNGWFVHWTGRDFSVSGEYSTIDSAIMISGAYFAAKYFDDPDITQLAKNIGSTPNYSLIFPDGFPDGPRMYMVSNGDGNMSAQTAPFNEYYILAYLAKMHETEGDTASSFFEECFGTTDKPVGRVDKPFFTNYNGHEMMSDYNHLITTFTVQFPFFACQAFHDNPWYMDTLYPNWYQAERDWWTRSDGANADWSAVDTSWGVSGLANRAYGAGAGDSPNNYHVQEPFSTIIVLYKELLSIS